MTDDDFKNLEHSLNRHDGELDLMLKRITELEEDLKLVIKFCKPNAVVQARHRAMESQPSEWSNRPPGDPVFQEKCRKFAEKYSALASEF
jgi:hypothetical protein